MAVDNFQRRMEPAARKEETDAANLEQKYGCIVTPFGQAQLPENVRESLRKHPDRDHIYLRWLADRLVSRPDLCDAGVSECMWLADSKYSPPDKHHYSAWLLEQNVHAAHRLQRVALGLPIVYIWPDGLSCSYVEDLTDDVLRPGSWNGSGSGTDFWYVPKKLTRSLDEVFGKSVDVVRRTGDSVIAIPSASRHKGVPPTGGYLNQQRQSDYGNPQT